MGWAWGSYVLKCNFKSRIDKFNVHNFTIRAPDVKLPAHLECTERPQEKVKFSICTPFIDDNINITRVNEWGLYYQKRFNVSKILIWVADQTHANFSGLLPIFRATSFSDTMWS